MFPRRGDVFECPVCGFQIRVNTAPQASPLLMKEELKCVCGATLQLLQSGSESVDGGHNKMISPSADSQSSPPIPALPDPLPSPLATSSTGHFPA